MFKIKKGITPLISGVLYFGISMAAIVVILDTVVPWMETTKDQIAIDYAKKNIADLDSIITTVASEGEDSSRIISLDIKRGKYFVDEASNVVYFEINVSKDILSPRFITKTGNVFFGSQLNSKAIDHGSYYILENQYLRVNISKVGNATSHSTMYTSDIINSMYFKEKEVYLYKENITILPENYVDEGNGTGYVYLEEDGILLPNAIAIAHMANANSGSSYDLYFDLPSDSDFLMLYLKNYVSS